MIGDLLKIISEGESETVEFKKSTGLMREIIETVCAFANHRGGYVFIGIEDKGKIVGQQVTDDTLKNISNAVKLNTDSKLYPNIEKIEIQGKTCILITVEESPLKPHLAYGKPFLRVGPSNQQIDRQRYEYMLQQRMNGYGFDNQIQADSALSDIDTESLYEFLELANSVRNINENTFLPPDIILEKLELSKNHSLTKAGMLLFGKNPERFFSNHYEIRCGYFSEDEGYDHIIHDKEFSRNIIANFYSSLGFIQDCIRKTTEKTGIYRTESWEFPLPVIREALVNMIVHRDYRQDIKSTVEIRPSFILFCNPAHLFEPVINIGRLKKHHPSRPGNKLIAKIFYLAGLFENWGSGTLKIVSDTVGSGKPEPDFSYEDGMFKLILYRK